MRKHCWGKLTATDCFRSKSCSSETRKKLLKCYKLCLWNVFSAQQSKRRNIICRDEITGETTILRLARNKMKQNVSCNLSYHQIYFSVLTWKIDCVLISHTACQLKRFWYYEVKFVCTLLDSQKRIVSISVIYPQISIRQIKMRYTGQ